MKNLLLLVTCLTASINALAGWVIDPAGSYVGFASVKNGLIAENHSFKQITGTIEDSGVANIAVAHRHIEIGTD